jgi:hypothetical protein
MWGKERSRPIPSASMAQHRPGKQQRKECCSVYAMTSISPTSMIRNHAFAIRLSNYTQPVMPTRTIVLPAGSGILAQAPAHPAARRTPAAGDSARIEKYSLLVRVRWRTLHVSFDGGLPVPAMIEREAAPVGMVPYCK